MEDIQTVLHKLIYKDRLVKNIIDESINYNYWVKSCPPHIDKAELYSSFVGKMEDSVANEIDDALEGCRTAVDDRYFYGGLLLMEPELPQKLRERLENYTVKGLNKIANEFYYNLEKGGDRKALINDLANLVD